jgi:hypothetical protein
MAARSSQGGYFTKFHIFSSPAGGRHKSRTFSYLFTLSPKTYQASPPRYGLTIRNSRLENILQEQAMTSIPSSAISPPLRKDPSFRTGNFCRVILEGFPRKAVNMKSILSASVVLLFACLGAAPLATAQTMNQFSPQSVLSQAMAPSYTTPWYRQQQSMLPPGQINDPAVKSIGMGSDFTPYSPDYGLCGSPKSSIVRIRSFCRR